MKKTILTSVITTLVTMGIIAFVSHFICGHKGCRVDDMHGDKMHKEMRLIMKHDCDTSLENYCRMHHSGDSAGHCCAMNEGKAIEKKFMIKLDPDFLKEERKNFENELSEEEKATIAECKKVMGDIDFLIENGKVVSGSNQKEFELLQKIAENHKESLEKVHAIAKEKMHGNDMMFEHGGEMKEHHENFMKIHFLILDF